MTGRTGRRHRATVPGVDVALRATVVGVDERATVVGVVDRATVLGGVVRTVVGGVTGGISAARSSSPGLVCR